ITKTRGTGSIRALRPQCESVLQAFYGCAARVWGSKMYRPPRRLRTSFGRPKEDRKQAGRRPEPKKTRNGTVAFARVARSWLHDCPEKGVPAGRSSVDGRVRKRRFAKRDSDHGTGFRNSIGEPRWQRRP